MSHFTYILRDIRYILMVMELNNKRKQNLIKKQIIYTLMKKKLAIIGALISGGLGISVISSALTVLASECPTCHN
jgi:hypothetical protein